MGINILILGGTTEASALSRRLAARAGLALTLSYAGRTHHIIAPEVPTRVGGFGGIEGLARYLEEHRIDALIDATHPFAAQISAHAAAAAAATATPILRLERPAWTREAGDRWIEVADMASAAFALGPAMRRVFLTIGRLEIEAFAAAPQHDYLVRAVDAFEPPPALRRCRVIAARGPFALADERRLIGAEAIEIIVSKNSGGTAAYAKIAAARELGLPVVMVTRPKVPAGDVAASVEEAMAWFDRLHG